MCIEPSDQKRSGVAAKQRIRASAPMPVPLADQGAETMSATAPDAARLLEQAARQGSRRRLVLTVAIALAVGAGATLLLSRPHPPVASVENVPSVPSSNVTESRAAALPPTSPASAPHEPSSVARNHDPEPVSIEFVEAPDRAREKALETAPNQAGPHAAVRSVRVVPAAQAVAKVGGRGDGGVSPAGSASGPAPSGTAAFGAQRD
jgi:hypothetical protein